MADIVVVAGRLQDAVALLPMLNTLTLHLFANDFDPAVDSLLADFTECAFPGYVSVVVNGWGTPTINSLSQGEILEVVRLFTLTSAGGPFPIYGYFLTLPGGQLYGAVRDPAAPVMLSTVGQSYVVQCQRTVGDPVP